jgi:hypothetical protein
LKAEAATSPRPETKALYKSVLAAEIDCEHAELLMLAGRADALCGAVDEEGSAAVMAVNLDTFFEASDVTLEATDKPVIAAILKAAGTG